MIVRAELEHPGIGLGLVMGAQLLGFERRYVERKLLDDLGEALQRMLLFCWRGKGEIDPDVQLAGDVGNVECMRIPHQHALQGGFRVHAVDLAQPGRHGVEQAVVANTDAGVSRTVADARHARHWLAAAHTVGAAGGKHRAGCTAGRPSTHRRR